MADPIFNNLFTGQRPQPTFPSANVDFSMPPSAPLPSPPPQGPSPAAPPSGGVDIDRLLQQLQAPPPEEQPMDKMQLMLKLVVPAIATAMAFKKGMGPAIGGLGEGYMQGEKLQLDRDELTARKQAQREAALGQRADRAQQLLDMKLNLEEKLRARQDSHRKMRAEMLRRAIEPIMSREGAFEQMRAKGLQGYAVQYEDPETGQLVNVPLEQAIREVGAVMAEGPGGVELPGAKPAPPPPKEPMIRDYTGRDTFEMRPQKPGETYRDRPQPPSEKKEPDLVRTVIEGYSREDPTFPVKYEVWSVPPTREGKPAVEVFRRALTPEGPPPEEGEPIATSKYKVGDEVTHNKLGKIIITEIFPDGTFDWKKK